jgi:hypothetical protein
MKIGLAKVAALVAALAIAAALLAPALAQEKPKASSSSPFQELFDQSMKEKKGLTLYLEGQVLGGAVTKVGAETVELRSQEFSKIVVRIEEIQAAAIH